MRRKGMIGLASLAALAAILSGGQDAPTVELSAEIWVLGDSVGVGIAGALRRAGVPTYNDAQNSTTARQWLRWLKERAQLPRGRRFVVVSLGTNDGIDQDLRREFTENARKIVEELTRHGHVVCWVLPPSTHSRIPSTVDLERLTQLDVALVQERVAMADEWHPTAFGYDQLAATIRRVKAARS